MALSVQFTSKQETYLQPYSDKQAKEHDWPIARQVAKRSDAAGSGYCTSVQVFLQSFGFMHDSNCLTYAAAASVKLSLLPTQMIIRISKEWRILFNEIHQPLFEALYIGVEAFTIKLVKTFKQDPKGRRLMFGADPESQVKFGIFQADVSTQKFPWRCKVTLEGDNKQTWVSVNVGLFFVDDDEDLFRQLKALISRHAKNVRFIAVVV